MSARPSELLERRGFNAAILTLPRPFLASRVETLPTFTDGTFDAPRCGATLRCDNPPRFDDDAGCFEEDAARCEAAGRWVLPGIFFLAGGAFLDVVLATISPRFFGSDASRAAPKTQIRGTRNKRFASIHQIRHLRQD